MKEYNKRYIAGHKNSIKKQTKKWKKNNPEKVREQKKRYRKKYSIKIKEYQGQYTRKYYQNNKGKIKEQSKQWQRDNREKRNNYEKIRRKIDLNFKLNRIIGSAIWQSLKDNKAGRKWENLIGYDVVKLKNHLKKTMPKGYTWQDYLSGELHIDHIIPKSAFNFTKSEHTDFKRCWALKNLRLLPIKENLTKHNKLVKPFQLALKI